MAEASSRAAVYTTEDVVELLEDGDGDEIYFPGSDEELGFDEDESDDLDEDSGDNDDLDEDNGDDDDLKEVAVNKFRSSTGPRVPIPASILGTFYLFFVPALLEYIVQQTNFGFLILMGLVPLPALADYWSKDEVFHYKPIASRISRDRFFELGRYLHFADNSTLAPPVSEASKCGFSLILQMAVSCFEVYTGKKGNTVEKQLGSTDVKTMTASHISRFHWVFFDNFFPSVDLMLDLERVGIYSCGTLRANRKGFPSDLKTAVKKCFKERGASQTRQCENLTVSQHHRPQVLPHEAGEGAHWLLQVKEMTRPQIAHNSHHLLH